MTTETEILVRRTVRLFDKTCQSCGTAFTGPSTRIYCTKQCQQRTMSGRYRQRRREEGQPPAKSGGPLKEWDRDD